MPKFNTHLEDGILRQLTETHDVSESLAHELHEGGDVTPWHIADALQPSKMGCEETREKHR